MKSWLGVAAAAAMALAAGPAVSASDAVDGLGRLPAVEGVQISPDGKRIALIATHGDDRQVVVETIASGQVEAQLTVGTEKLRAIQWATDSRLVITTSTTTALEVGGPRVEWFEGVASDRAPRRQTPLLEGPDLRNGMGAVPEIRMTAGRPAAFIPGVSRTDAGSRRALYKVDLATGRTTPADALSEAATAWVVDGSGSPVALATYEGDVRRWTLSVRSSDGWKRVHSEQVDMTAPALLGLGRDGRSILARVDDGSGPSLREYDAQARRWSDPLVAGDDPEPIFDQLTHALVGVHVLDGDTDRYLFFSPGDQRAWDATTAAYPGSRVTLQSMSADHRKLVVLVAPATEGPAYALVDLDAHTARWISPAYPDVAEHAAPETSIVFGASDGQALTGYLTTPPGREAKALPLVVLAHGGPAERDVPGFDWWAQAMAARGYAVLRVNFRGSWGLGQSLFRAGFGQWGGRMQTDLSDGVRYLAGQGIIDARRVCIVGAGYGGYAALAGATLESGVYRCAASVAGIGDLNLFELWLRGRGDAETVRALERYVGAHAGEPALGAVSPANHAAAASGPILLVHGRDDTVIPYEQSLAMAQALKKAGKPFGLVTLAHEDHWLSRGETRLQMLKAVIDFLQRNNPPD